MSNSRVRDLADNNIVFVDGISTLDITESNNLFFTNARADARISLKMIDEDNMSSNSSAHMPTQQSVKSYVDTEVSGLVDTAPGTLDTLNELAAALGDDANFSTTVTNSIAAKLPLAGGAITGNVTFGDNNKAIFGAGSDLQIYHDGNHSIIEDAGTGAIKIKVGDFRVENASGNNLIKGVGDVATLHHAGTEKLATTSTGIDVTGTVTSDGLFVDTDSIYSVSGTNRVGINKTSPGTTLDVGGSIFFSSILRSTTGGSASSPSIQPGLDGDTGMFWPAANNIGFTTAGAERLRIDPNGKIFMNEGVPFSWTDSSLNVSAEIYGDASDNLVFRNTSAKTERMRIDASGNVGIGNDSPSAPLHIKKSISSTYTGGNTGIVNSLFNITNTLSTSTVNAQANIQLGIYDGTYNRVTGIAAVAESATNRKASLVFWTDDENTRSEKLRITGDGNVGIGTSSPDTNLHVFKASAGTITNYVNNALVVENSGDVGISLLTPNSAAGHLMFGSPGHQYHSYIRGQYGASTTSTLRFFTDNINTMTHKAGNVGIGTDSPNANLDIEGSGAQVLSIYSTDTGSQQVAKTFINLYGENTASEKKLQAQIASSPGHNATNAGEMHFSTNNSSSALTRRMTIREDGAVGIGTNNPVAKLHVYNENGGNATDKATMLSEAVMKIQPHTTNSTNLLVAQVNGGNGIGLQVTNGPATANWDLALSPFGGDVGIGTAAPGEKLHVEGSIRASGNIGVTQTDGDYLAKLYQSSADGFLELSTGEASPVVRTKLGAYGTNYIVPNGTTSTNQAMLSVGESIGAKSGVFNIRSTSSTVGGYRHRMAGGTDYKNVASINTGSGTTPYWHIKTNIAYNQSVMFIARVHGYAYGNAGHIIDVSRSGYAYSGSASSVIGTQLANAGSTSFALDTYYANSGINLCFRFNCVGSYYLGVAFDIKMQSPTGYNHDFAVIGQVLNNTSGNHYT